MRNSPPYTKWRVICAGAPAQSLGRSHPAAGCHLFWPFDLAEKKTDSSQIFFLLVHLTLVQIPASLPSRAAPLRCLISPPVAFLVADPHPRRPSSSLVPTLAGPPRHCLDPCNSCTCSCSSQRLRLQLRRRPSPLMLAERNCVDDSHQPITPLNGCSKKLPWS